MRGLYVIAASLFISALCIGNWSLEAAVRGPAACEKLTRRDRSKCLGDARRNRSDEGDKSQPTTTKTKMAPTESDKIYTPLPKTSTVAVWGRINVSSPAGFQRFDQLNSDDSRLYASSAWAEGMDTVSQVARKKLTCLVTVYAMIEQGRGNSNFRVSSDNYSDQVGALGISGIGSSRPLIEMEVVRSEFQKGNPVILWGPLTRNPADQFGHFILAVGVNSSGQIVAHDPYGGQVVTIDPRTRRVSVAQMTGLGAGKATSFAMTKEGHYIDYAVPPYTGQRRQPSVAGQNRKNSATYAGGLQGDQAASETEGGTPTKLPADSATAFIWPADIRLEHRAAISPHLQNLKLRLATVSDIPNWDMHILLLW